MALLGGCQPDAGPPLSLLSGPRLLALRGTPAEVAPGAPVLWDALVGTPNGEETPPLDWWLCHAPRPLTTNDVVAPECLSASGVDALATAPSVSAQVPGNACQLFGPELPPSVPGKPDPRPVAADASGGWYQPYRADLDASESIGLQRIRCNLSGASSDVAAQFQMQYRVNVNPQPNAIRVDGSFAPGAHLLLTVDWPQESAETFPVFDVRSQTLVQHREALRVSWFATGGSFGEEHTGRASDDNTLESQNSYIAPASGEAHVWAVLRDDRGGVGWTHTLLK